MKFMFFWLKDYLDIDVFFDEIFDVLIDFGFEVEGVVNFVECLFEFIIVKVNVVEKYLDVDKLKVC